jgi:hypothetical protein
MQALHTSSGCVESFYAHCTRQGTGRSVPCNKLEVSEGSGIDDKKCYQKMPHWNSEWLLFSMENEFVIFRISNKYVSKCDAGVDVLS